MINTFHCGNLGLIATQLYCNSLTISYKKIINKICVEPLSVKLELLHTEIIMDSLCISLTVNVNNIHSGKYGQDMRLTKNLH